MTSEEIKLIAEAVTQSVNENVSQLIDEKLEPIKERLEIIEEDIEIIRYSTNELVRWVDYNFRHKYPFPVDKDQAI